MKYYRVLLLIIGFFLLFSCKKNKDDSSPVIRIYKPSENAAFNVGDSIYVEFTVEDDIRIERVSYMLETDDQHNVQHERIFYPDAKSYSVSEYYPLYDSSLQSNYYNIHIRAYNGVNYRNVYRQIMIEGIPREFLYIMVHVKTNAGESALLKIDTDPGQTVLKTFSGDYRQLVVNNHSRIIAVGGEYLSPVNTFKLNNLEPAWSIPVIPNPPFLYFTGISLQEQLLTIQFYDGYLRFYREDGQPTLSVNCIPGRIPIANLLTNNRIVTAEISAGGEKKYINAYYRVSGVHEQSMQTNLVTLHFEMLDDDNVFCFGNEGANAKVIIYNILSNTAYIPANLPLGELLSVQRISDKIIILGIGNSLYLFNTETFISTEYLSGSRGEQLAWEDISSIIVAAEGSTVLLIGFPQPQLLHTISLADSILDIDLVYNREIF